MKSVLLCLVMAGAILNTGCVTLQSVSLTQIPKKRSKAIKAESSKFLFLGIAFDNDHAEAVNNSLMQKCPNGKVEGVFTQHYNTNYFLVLVKSTVEVHAYCNRGSRR